MIRSSSTSSACVAPFSRAPRISSTATAFVLGGAKLVFTDIRPDTMNIDETKIEAAITPRTRAIVAVHYAGMACEMDAIMDIARRHGLIVIEDAAQGVMSSYKGRALGTIGDLGCYSFHETKNYSMGEGGALIINDPKYNERAEILREKGTNRSKFFRGQVDKYTWVDFGDSYLPSELNAAYLWAQLLRADEINNDRLNSWNEYNEAFKPLAEKALVELPVIPEGCGLMSLCIIPRSWACDRAFAICFVKCRASRQGTAPRLSIYCLKVIPSTNSITMYSMASLWLTS